MKRGRGKRQAQASDVRAANEAARPPAMPPPPGQAPRPSRPATPSPATAPTLGSDLPLLPFARHLPRWLVPPADTKALPIGWFLLVLLAIWTVGTLVRMGWLFAFGWEAEAVQWQGTPFLTSADGYYFAAGLQAALDGDAHGRTRLPEPGDSALIALGFVVGKLFGLSADSVALYFPAVVAPAIAVPVAWIGRMLGRSGAGLVAALAVVVAPGLYMRTTAGYFDTDTFAVTIPLVAIACFVAMAVRARAVDAPRREPGDPGNPGSPGLAGAAVLAAYPFFYDQGHPVGMAVALVAIAYLVVFHRKEAWAWFLIAALGLGQMRMHWTVLVPLVLVTPSALRVISSTILTKLPDNRARAAALVLSLAIALLGLARSHAWTEAANKIELFSGSDAPVVASDQEPAASDAGGLADSPADPVFRDTTKFVAEAQKLPLSDLGRRVLGNLPLALLGLAGMLLLVLRQRALVLIAPLVALGLFSIIGGLRFTIYLSPVAAIGAGWVVAIVAGLVPRAWARVALTVGLAVAVALPGTLNVIEARPRPSVVAPEVAALDALRGRLQPGDVVVSWWDYGYAISHFARARTIVDGGRRHRDTNLVAEMLLGSSQRAAANLARVTVAAMAERRGSVAGHVFREARERGLGPVAWLASLDRPDAVVPDPESDIYFYLPARMLTILPAIDQLRPSEAGHTRPPLRGAPPLLARADGERLLLPGGAVVDGKTMTIKAKRGDKKLKRIFSIAGGAGKPIDVKSRDGDPSAVTNGVFIRNTGLFAEMDDRLLSSVFVQLFAFERADPAHFELVFANEAAKIYRLR